MAPAPTTTGSRRELAHRSGDGLDVTLFWNADTNDVVVSVFDARRSQQFDVTAPPALALDAFRHPFAYADIAPQDELVAA